ncbi:MAG: hypothetical protein IKA70_04595 [Alistipes sp.]|nr:hypothetical protein [Alistipes sp.]
MRRVIAIMAVSLLVVAAKAQSRKELLRQIEALSTKIETLEGKVAEVEREKVSRTTPCNPQWEKWSDVRYNYGFNTSKTPIFNTIDGVVEATVMMSVRGGLGRWNSTVGTPYSKFVDGGHLFEGWNASETCRLTMLIGKQAPDIACIQVYSPKGLYRTKRHFGWVKLGSDDANEGVDFGRRWAKSFVPFTLATLDKAPTDTYVENSQLGSAEVPVGTLYYDTTTNSIACMTPTGWQYISFE